MARRPTSREYFLIGVLVVAGIVAVWVGRGGGFNLGGDGGSKDEAPEIGEAPQILMARLSRPAEDYDPRGRNLFDYWTPPPPQPPRIVPRKPPPRPMATTPPKAAPPPKPRPPRSRGPKPPGIAFTYLGFLGPKDDKIAVFEHGEGEMTLARVGEIVQRQFRVVDFGYETVVMGYTDERFKDRTTELAMKAK